MVHIREMSVTQFWGLHLQPGETYIQKALFDFHVTMAALDVKSLQSKDDKPHSVYCLHSTSRYLLCTLSRGKVWQQQLDLYFTEGEELGFLVEGGDAEVHLTGHVIPDDSDEAPELVEMDNAMDYFSGGKRKREADIKNQVLASKSKKMRLEDMDDEDYNSDEDEDFEVDDDSDFQAFQAYLDDEAEEDEEDEEDEEGDSEEEYDFDMDDSEEDEKKLPVTAKGKKNGLGKKGTPGKGSPVKAQPSKGTPGKPTPGKPTPGKPTPGKPTPGKPTPGPGSPVKATPGKKDKKPQTPGQNKSAGKNVATPVPQTPKSVNTTQNSEGESSKKKRKRNKKKKNKSNTNTPTVSDQASPATPSNLSQQQSSKAKQQQTPQGKQTPKAQSSAGAGRQVLAGGTVVQELREGQGPAAKPGQKVAVYYRGCLASGKQFDSKTEGKPFKFRLGAGQVIKGWDVGLQGMKVGGKRKITVPPSQGYGNARQGPIPPNSSLVFEVELKGVS